MFERIWVKFNRRRVIEFLQFCIVGSSGVVVNMGLLYILTRFANVRVEFASPIAIEISIITNFLFNNYWTFRKRDTDSPFILRMLKYHLVTGLAGIINYLILLLLVKGFHINDLIANMAGIILGTLINFSLNSLWTWKINK